jgi:two-component system, LuxR family, sensor kinase FixL
MSDAQYLSNRLRAGADGDFQAIFEQAAAALFILTSDDHFEFVNDAFCRLLGYSRQELLAMTAGTISHPADREAGSKRLEQLKTGIAGSYQVEKRWLHQSGQIIAGVESGCAVFAPDSTHFRIFCHVHHSVPSNRALADLLASERLAAINELVAGLAHESRNALQQISACAEMLAMEFKHLPDALDLVAGMQDAEDRLHRLFEDMRIYATPLYRERRQCEIADLWRNAWAALVASRPGRQLRFVEHLAPGTAAANVAVNYLERAFVKIFENSLDACKDPVEIEVSTAPAEINQRPAVRVSVRDSGTGFTTAAMARAFEPFYTSKAQGTGLGLPIVRRIIEAHGGKVDVENVPKGGAVVHLSLPRAE